MDAENIIFAARGVRYCFRISDVLGCTAAYHTVTYENSTAVLRGDMSGVLYGERIYRTSL